MSDFKTCTFGKWIFSGEHSVLRGGPALVFPLFKRKLELEYFKEEKSGTLLVEAFGENADDIKALFTGVLVKALSLLNKPEQKIIGTIRFVNELPLGAGMGASSSLCVAFSRWFSYLKLIEEVEIYEFARQLENIFHGESSGVDIAVVLHEKPLIFKRPNNIEILNIENYFKLYLSHTGQKGITKDCVIKVNEFIKMNPERSFQLDAQMIQATQQAIEVFLSNSSKNEKALKLVPIINSGYECFKEWGLTEGRVENHISKLKAWGALAAKPTGSGGGGYVLSLWPQDAPEIADFEMIPLFK